MDRTKAEGVVELGALSDAKCLEELARAIFTAGFSEEVVKRKWPGIREAFARFRPERVAAFDDDELAELMQAPGIIRNRAKILATVRNARLLEEIAAEHGSVGGWLASLPPDPLTRISTVASRFERVGPKAATMFLAAVTRERDVG